MSAGSGSDASDYPPTLLEPEDTESFPGSDDASSMSVVEISSDDSVQVSQHLDIVSYWSKRIPRFELVWKESLPDMAIVWDLAPAQFADNVAEQHKHSEHAIQRYLDQGYIQQFKVGVTCQPVFRFRNPQFGYQFLRYSELVVLSVHDDAQRIADLEISLLRVYRKFNRRDYLVNPNGHPLCGNRAPGGENAFGGFAPYVCYMAIKRPVRSQALPSIFGNARTPCTL